MHKHVLHGLGRRRNSFWSFHWHEHHRACRQNQHIDEAYRGGALRWNAQGKEAFALFAASAAALPLLPVAPFFVATLLYCSIDYYRKHKRAHLEPNWAREHLSWHYDHHMGPNQHANWCVTRPWFDILMKTRQPYAGTERERRDVARHRARAASSSEGAVDAGVGQTGGVAGR